MLKFTVSPGVTFKILPLRYRPDRSTPTDFPDVPTVSVHVAVNPPSAVVTVMVLEPAAIAVTLPAASTIATDGVPDVHVTFLFVALEGLTVTDMVYVLPAARERVDGFSVTPVTEVCNALTVNVHVAVNPPSSVVAVMSLVPAAIAVILPLASIVATDGVPDVQVTFLFVAATGRTVLNMEYISPTFSDRLNGYNMTLATGIDNALTVTIHISVNPPSTVSAMMTLVPSDNAVTLPSASTIATDGILDVHVTFLFVAYEGSTAATSVLVPPIPRFRVCQFRDMPLTEAAVTVTSTLLMTLNGISALTSVPPLLPSTVIHILAAQKSSTLFGSDGARPVTDT